MFLTELNHIIHLYYYYSVIYALVYIYFLKLDRLRSVTARTLFFYDTLDHIL